MPDMTDVAKEIDQLLQAKMGGKVAFTLAYGEPNDGMIGRQFHWITNVKREDGIKVMRGAVEAMQAQVN